MTTDKCAHEFLPVAEVRYDPDAVAMDDAFQGIHMTQDTACGKCGKPGPKNPEQPTFRIGDR